MIIGIDASRAFIAERTGTEEYSYQLIKHLAKYLKDDQVVLYIRKNQKPNIKIRDNGIKSKNNDSLEIPGGWSFKVINYTYFWTQIGLSLEMLFHPVGILFVPAHVAPFICAKNTIIAIHGLEYEFCPRAYSWLDRLRMRWSVKMSCGRAGKIIAVSGNTKNDLMKLYKIPGKKIRVIHEGCDLETRNEDVENNGANLKINQKYLLFIGRMEERKNIIGIIKAFEILKEKYNIPHKLVLVGKPGFGYEKIRFQIQNAKYQKDIIETGYVDGGAKRRLLLSADVFLFPTFYEGFGLPILEAQLAGCPVVAGNNSSIPELVSRNFQFAISDFQTNSDSEDSELKINPICRDVGKSAVLVNPRSEEQIAEAVHGLISDERLRNDIIKKGYENAKRFSWKKCAFETAKVLKNE